MRLMDPETEQQVREVLAAVKSPVTLKMFTQDFDCEACNGTRQIIEEVADLSDLISVEVHDFAAESDLARSLGADKVPAIFVLDADRRDRGIRFFGIPAGYEFTSLIEAIVLVGTGDSALEDDTRKFLDALQTPLHLQVFVTPTCPHCPRAVMLAHQLAYASDKVTADMVEVTEFPHLGQKYDVMGVPRTVINEHAYLEGAAPEQVLLEKLKAAVQ